ncbi:acetate uptake transporter [Thermotalea metallivorans]|uniref:Succinate-acetate/proton symporter SatP n=1 Tax=Thermotalea metallivorans TaxID=520762 RepID=A0A140L9G8_9FIRM|nr:GPR1/FUN34/YaaH family transporter [Thermotalea metallivorans]KXG77193.1 Succinate-acetate/proton symporter SatP [Thermotalea metallivorans]
MNTQETQHVKITNADPSALGLFGLAMVTLVASSQKLGWTGGLSFVIPWAIFLGGFAQLFACIEDSKRHNLFGTTAFGAYGLFWVAVAASWLTKLGFFGEALAANIDGRQLGFAFIGYLIFSIYMTVAATETNRVLFYILFLIDILFLGLSMNTFGILPEFSHKLAAYTELLISMLGFYASAAAVLNGHFGRIFLPVGKPMGIFKK